MEALERRWKEAAGTRPPSRRTAKELAIAFRRDMQSEVDLIRRRVLCDWVQRMYPIFCEAESAIAPPAWKDFACELKVTMPKKRLNDRKDGKRVRTGTYYLVPDPAAAVVELAAGRRRA